MSLRKPKDKKATRAQKRGAEEHTASSRRTKRRAAGYGLISTPVEAVAPLSEEELFKLRNAAEFDVPSKQVEVKDEPTDTLAQSSNTTRLPAVRHGPGTAVALCGRSSQAMSSAHAASSQESTNTNDREAVLDTLLFQTFTPEMTQHVVQQILQDDQDSACRGNEFGIAYIEARIERLQRRGNPPSRLAEVIQLFQQGLRDLSNRFRSRINSVGGNSVLSDSSGPGHAPIRVGEAPGEQHVGQHHDIPYGPYARPQATGTKVVSVSRKHLAMFEAAHCQSDSSTSTDEEAEDTPSKNVSRYLDVDNEEYRADADEDPDRHSHYSGDTSMYDHQVNDLPRSTCTDSLYQQSSIEMLVTSSFMAPNSQGRVLTSMLDAQFLHACQHLVASQAHLAPIQPS
jgi:hypothetical protein